MIHQNKKAPGWTCPGCGEHFEDKEDFHQHIKWSEECMSDVVFALGAAFLSIVDLACKDIE